MEDNRRVFAFRSVFEELDTLVGMDDNTHGGRASCPPVSEGTTSWSATSCTSP